MDDAKDPAFERVLESLKARRPEWFAESLKTTPMATRNAVPVRLDARQKAAGEREDDECPF